MATTDSGLLDAEQGRCCSQEQEEVINFNIAFYGQRSTVYKYNFVEIIKPTTATGVFLFNNVYTQIQDFQFLLTKCLAYIFKGLGRPGKYIFEGL